MTMQKLLIVLGVTFLAGALAVSVIAGPSLQGGKIGRDKFKSMKGYVLS
jgi:hypothetical protein